jgi:hypothetical protein
MTRKITEHIFSIILVTLCLLLILLAAQRSQKQAQDELTADIQDYLELEFIDYSNPFHKGLLKDVVNIFYPGQYDKNEERLKTLFQYKQDLLLEELQSSHLKQSLSGRKLRQIFGAYLKFVFIYLLVMILTYYGVQTLGVWRFVRRKQMAFGVHADATAFTLANFKKNPLIAGLKILLLILKKIFGFLISLILFSPAYVIAYSLRTEFDTDVLLFVVILGVISNGLLMMYTNKFYNFLLAESRKGYVETAIAKNLNNSYTLDTPDGIQLKDLFSPLKKFKGHVFSHIFKNAQHQYLSTLKEQAVFIITGLIIIEMALNIHGYLNYEMLKQLLHKNYSIVVVIIMLIFFTVKLTEIFTDLLVHRAAARYGNK